MCKHQFDGADVLTQSHRTGTPSCALVPKTEDGFAIQVGDVPCTKFTLQPFEIGAFERSGGLRTPCMSSICKSSVDTRPNPACTRLSRAIMNTSAVVRSVCSLALIRSPFRLMPLPGTDAALAKSLKSSSCLSDPNGDQADPQQSFGRHFRRDQDLACGAARRTPRIYPHDEARLLAQSNREFLLQAYPLGAPPCPRRVQTGIQGSHHGCDGTL